MTAPRDPDRLIRAFLDEGRDGAARPGLRRGPRPTSTEHVSGSSSARGGNLACPASRGSRSRPRPSLVVAVLGINLLPSSNVGGLGSPSPSTRPSTGAATSPSAVPTPPSSTGATASLAPLSYEWPKPLQAGTYTTPFIWKIPFSVSFTVPDGWESRDVEVLRGSTLSVSVQLVDNVYADPCKPTERAPKVNSSVLALSTALAALPGADTTAPILTTLAGYSSWSLDISIPASGRCPPGQSYSFWTNAPASVVSGRGPMGPLTWGAELPNSRIWILDVEGVRLVISAQWSSDATSADRAELQAVVDSIRIVPPTGSR